MTDPLERVFERFRQSGDSEALGRVFDATAPRLMQLAIHLVGDIGAAEDLVGRPVTWPSTRNFRGQYADLRIAFSGVQRTMGAGSARFEPQAPAPVEVRKPKDLLTARIPAVHPAAKNGEGKP